MKHRELTWCGCALAGTWRGLVTDLELLRRYARHGRDGDLDELLRRCYPHVYAVCWRHLRHQQDAEDAAQEVFLALIRNTRRIHSHLAGWLHRCAVQTAIGVVRKKQARRRIEREYSSGVAAGAPPHEKREAACAVEECLAQMPDRERDLVVRNLIDKVPQRVLAAERGISQQAIAKQLSRSLEMLSHALRHRGVSLSIGALAATLRSMAGPPATAAAISSAAAAVEEAGIIAGATLLPGAKTKLIAALLAGVCVLAVAPNATREVADGRAGRESAHGVGARPADLSATATPRGERAGAFPESGRAGLAATSPPRRQPLPQRPLLARKSPLGKTARGVDAFDLRRDPGHRKSFLQVPGHSDPTETPAPSTAVDTSGCSHPPTAPGEAGSAGQTVGGAGGEQKGKAECGLASVDRGGSPGEATSLLSAADRGQDAQPEPGLSLPSATETPASYAVGESAAPGEGLVSIAPEAGQGNPEEGPLLPSLLERPLPRGWDSGALPGREAPEPREGGGLGEAVLARGASTAGPLPARDWYPPTRAPLQAGAALPEARSLAGRSLMVEPRGEAPLTEDGIPGDRELPIHTTDGAAGAHLPWEGAMLPELQLPPPAPEFLTAPVVTPVSLPERAEGFEVAVFADDGHLEPTLGMAPFGEIIDSAGELVEARFRLPADLGPPGPPLPTMSLIAGEGETHAIVAAAHTRQTVAVPEPSTWWLAVLGALGLVPIRGWFVRSTVTRR